MADYWGWKEIEQRLGYKQETLARWIISRGLPVIRRPAPFRLRPQLKAPSVPRVYINDELITRWEQGQAAEQRRERIQRREERQRVNGQPQVPRRSLTGSRAGSAGSSERPERLT